MRIANKTESSNVINRRKKLRFPDVTSVMGLKELKKKLNDGTFVISGDNNGTRFTEVKDNFILNPCEKDSFMSKLKKLNSGTYGTAYNVQVKPNDNSRSKGEDLLIIKESKFDSTKVSNFSGMFVEPRIMYIFSQTMVYNGHTPHLPPIFGFASCKKKNTTIEKNGEILDYSAFIVSKKAHYGDLENYLKKHSENVYETIRQVLFEAAYTFSLIQTLYPQFLHNDIKLNNVLADLGPVKGVTKYSTNGRKHFYVPNSGMRLLIWDFDFSSITGVVDNVKTAYFQYQEKDSGIASFRNVPETSGLDLCVLATFLMEWLIENKSSEAGSAEYINFVAQWESTWGDYSAFDYDDGSYQTILIDMEEEDYDYDTYCPTPMSVLMDSPLFSIYKKKPRSQSMIVQTYSMTEVSHISSSDLDNIYKLTHFDTNFNVLPLLPNIFKNVPSSSFYPNRPPIEKQVVATKNDFTRLVKSLEKFVENYYMDNGADYNKEILKQTVEIVENIQTNLFLRSKLTLDQLTILLFFVYFEETEEDFELRKMQQFLGKFTYYQLELALVQWTWLKYYNFEEKLTIDSILLQQHFLGTIIY